MMKLTDEDWKSNEAMYIAVILVLAIGMLWLLLGLVLLGLDLVLVLVWLFLVPVLACLKPLLLPGAYLHYRKRMKC